MAPQPRRHKPQTQPITTTLANILRDYHAGSTVLRELLQNADDAGASRINFHLHTEPPPSTTPYPLLHSSLLEYQGPALLAHNNHPPFRPEDFDSLSHVGDSCKRFDASKTGKFGLGFNSVYNWTDCPSVLSGESLLLLDPHHGWSAELETPGGPVYDVVADAAAEEMRNQLEPFRRVLGRGFQGSLDGTIVRIPLRTRAQAGRSRICQRVVEVEEMRGVLEGFAGGLGGGYGVFLRGVEVVELWEGGEKIGAYEVVNTEAVARARTEINTAYDDVFVRRSRAEFDAAFEMEVEVSLPGGLKKRSTWMVQHLMRRDVGEALTEWGAERKLFGWGLSLDDFTGGLFTVLPLGKTVANHPVHLHGLFSITSDRANLHTAAEKNMQDPNPFLWNEMLFDSLFPIAWTKLLTHLCRSKPQERNLMHFWPRAQAVIDQLGENISGKMYELAAREGLRLFFTEQRYVNVDEGLFVRAEDVNNELRTSLDAVGLPVVYLQPWEDWIFNRVQATSPSRLLTPRALCDFLRSSNPLGNITPTMKAALLEYVLSHVDINAPDDGFGMLRDIPLFPLESGAYQSVGHDHPRIFICLDERERYLFRRQPTRNLNCDMLSAETSRLLKALAVHEDIGVTAYSLEDFSDYCMEKVFMGYSEQGDVISCSPELREFVIESWTWIRCKWNRSLRPLRELWLLPLRGDYLRRAYTEHSTVPTLHSLSGPTGQLLLRFAALSQKSTPPPLLDEEILGEETREYLVSHGEEKGEVLLGDCEKLKNLLPWLVAGKEMVRAATDQDRRLCLMAIATKFKGELLAGKADTIAVTQALRQLPLFEKVQSASLGGVTGQKWSWIDRSGQTNAFVGFADLPFVPSVDGTTFIRMEDETIKDILTATGIAKCLPTTELIERYLIPALTRETCDLLSGAVKVTAVELIFHNYFSLSKESQDRIYQLPIVPVGEGPSSDKGHRFHSISELLHPTAAEIDELFFPDELLYPCRSLFNRFSGVMLQCGLRSKLTWPLALERIRLYAHTELALEKVAACVKKLLQLRVSHEAKHSPSELQEIKDLTWIPVRKPNGKSSLMRENPSNCRSSRDRLLVGRVVHILEYEVHNSWQNVLGWDTTFPVTTLVQQLQIGVSEVDMDIVDAVLSYVMECGLQQHHVNAIRSINCILGSGGTLFLPAKIFLDGAAKLEPYVGNVDHVFRKRHQSLLAALDLSTEPSVRDLLQVQDQLVALEQPLNRGDTAVAIEVVILASVQDREKLAKLKIPDQTGRLQDIDCITFWDLEFSSAREKTPLVHPYIPTEVIERLGIQSFSEKILMGKIGIHDQEDEDEFFQREEITVRIADTLDRYPVSTTFNEYLANAEDSGSARRVEWLLDECLKGSYPTERLLNKDLAAFQGQALFVYNDGVFLDRDFEGFRNVGRGSKREESWTIGQFGRGAQTMYHWTDVPMLISGKYFLVLDPQQKFLPLNRRHGRRKPGLKVELSKIREICSDQLAPFDGLWGYSRDLDQFEGTIFRFPLRLQGSPTTLTERKLHLNANATRELLDKYFQTARLSLIFLQRITHISFRLRHSMEPRFRTEYSERLFPLLAVQPYRYIRISYFYSHGLRKRVEGTDEWWIAKRDIDEVPMELKEWQKRVRRRVKDSKCGIALLWSSPKDNISQPQMFSTLPLPFASHLPVQINASFILSGDRQSILVGGTTPHEGSSWNKWLLQKPIPSLYVDFLEEITRRIGIKVYKYWPTGELSKDCASDLVREAFWGEVAKSRNILYPGAREIAVSHFLPTSQQGKQKDVPELPVQYELNEAVFDFISTSSSYALQNLFRGWFPRLVRVPGDRLPIDFRRLGPAMTELTPSMIRKKLQESDACDELQRCAVDNLAALDDLLDIILPKQGAKATEIAELDGCTVLPLQDGSLGTLRLIKSSPLSQPYFYVTSEERRLFSFASKLFTKGEVRGPPEVERPFERGDVGVEFVNWVVKSSAFNVKKLTLQDLGLLLQKRNISEWEFTPDLEKWLREFWFYFRLRMSDSNSESSVKKLEGSHENIAMCCGIGHFPIYLAAKGNCTVNISPASFETLPAILKPSTGFQSRLRLCERFSDLYIVDQKFTPSPPEYAQSKVSFFSRFLKAVTEIVSERMTTLENVVNLALDDSSRKTLLGLTRGALSGTKFESKYEPAARSSMRKLPVWPTLPGRYVTAENALTATDDRLVVPWLRRRYDFIEHNFFQGNSEILKKLGVNPLNITSMFSNHILGSLPMQLQLEDRGPYFLFIQAMAEFYEQDITRHPMFRERPMTTYSSWRLAADADGVMHRACELYDHEDKVYRASFSLQMPKLFLLPSVRRHREFWLGMGLRGGNEKPIDGQEYLKCLRSLENRIKQLKSPNSQLSALMLDIRAVLEGLARVQSSMYSSVRDGIISLSVVPTKTDMAQEPAFRRPAMQRWCDTRPFISLSEVIHSEHAPCCWTQAPFPLYSPPKSGFDVLKLKGSPPFSMIWDHLKALVNISNELLDTEVKEFLYDLSQTYRYLQEIAVEPVADLALERLWLNMDIKDSELPTAQQIRLSWMDVSHLVMFCPYDPGDMRYVRSFLMPYESLLKRCGCQPIRNPTWKKSEKQTSGPVVHEIRRLWKDQQLTDVAFKAEGETIVAHKLILAAASKYCEAQFAGPWSKFGASKGPIELEGMKHSTLLLMIEFAYHDDLDWKSMEVDERDTDDVADKLDILLELLAGADRWDMSRLHNMVESYIIDQARTFVRIDNMRLVEEIASDVQAKDLAGFCAKYRDENKDILTVVEREIA